MEEIRSEDKAQIPESFSKNEILFDNISSRYQDNQRKNPAAYLVFTISVAILSIALLLADILFGARRSESISSMSDLLSTVLAVENIEGSNEATNGASHVNAALLFPSREILDSAKDDVDTKKDEQSDIVGSESSEPKSDEKAAEEDSEKKYPILKLDLSGSDLGSEYISNETGYSPNIKALLERESGITTEDLERSPVVLIIHTHGTESYADEGKDNYIYDGGDISRSSDKEKNVVAIGKIIAEVLNENGINTLHCEIMHDEESYEESYSRAAKTIKSYISKYPTIKYVFDVHRDAILKPDGTLVGTACNIGGESVAQVMAVVGSDYKGANFPDWEDHLALALKLRDSLNSKYSNICRPVYLRGAAYNEQYAEGSLLLEIGSSGNTLTEAKKAAKLVAEALAEMIKGK